MQFTDQEERHHKAKESEAMNMAKWLVVSAFVMFLLVVLAMCS